MNRISHLLVSLGIVGLLALLLALSIVEGVAPARAAGNILYVLPGQSIQAAIDAATEGDEIWVAKGVYTENLSISKGIALYGGWNISFTLQTPGDSIVDGNKVGRVISITCATSDTVVTIDGFTIQNGDATGLGLPIMPEIPTSDRLSDRSEPAQPAPIPDLVSPSEQAAKLRARLADLAARGLYPGGAAAYQAMLFRLERLTVQAEKARARASAASVPFQVEQGLGSGGGVYSKNASLKLLNCTIEGNVASRDTLGVGGGVFVADAPPAGVRIANNHISANVGCMYGDGWGGGLYVVNAPGAIIGNNIVEANVASNAGNGYGGGLYVYESPGVVIQDNQFQQNLGSDAGYQNDGVGGGLGVHTSPGALVRNNLVQRNTANAAWNAYRGIGGGLFLTYSDGVIIRDNQVRENLGALRGVGDGGGVQLVWSNDALVADNEVTGNLAALISGQAQGGGIKAAAVYSATLSGNEIRENAACVYGDIEGSMGHFGGGIYGTAFENSRLIGNVITANATCHYCGLAPGGGFGGGAFISASRNAMAADNTIADNVGALSEGIGVGGGLHLRDTTGSQILRNRLLRNRAGVADESHGGGLVVDRFELESALATVDANLILDNQGWGCEIANTDGGVSLTNNVVAGNQGSDGGGVYLYAFPQDGAVVNNTIANNGGIGVLVDGMGSTVTFVNNIVVDHTVGIKATEGTTATVSYTLWHGNGTDIAGGGAVAQTHPVTGDPAFVDPAGHDYHLTLASAARDAGDPAGVPPAPDHDAVGVPRPQGPAVDLGAYEWQGHWVHLPLVYRSFPPLVGWATGGDATGTAAIAHTADGGLTWQVQGDSSAWTGMPGNDISAVDDQTAWAALGSSTNNTSGAILHTTDGGATWVTQTIPAGLAGGIKGVKGLSRHEAWAASLEGTILHTTDGGSTWNIVPHPTVPITQVNRIDALGTNIWIADASATGAIVHTQDGGLTWRAEYLPVDSPLTVHAFNPLAVWGSGSDIDLNPSFYRTVDGGLRWVKVNELGALDHLDDVCAASPDDAWGVQNGDSASGKIWRVHVAADGTPDAKNTSPPELVGYTPGGVTCLDTNVAWVVAQKGVPHDPSKPLGIILHTVDGEHWVQGSAPTNIRYWKVSFVGARR